MGSNPTLSATTRQGADHPCTAGPPRSSMTPVLELSAPMDSSELKYSIAFNKVSGVGRARMALLEGHFGSLRLAWEASSAAMVEAGPTAAPPAVLPPARRPSTPPRSLARLRRPVCGCSRGTTQTTPLASARSRTSRPCYSFAANWTPKTSARLPWWELAGPLPMADRPPIS